MSLDILLVNPKSWDKEPPSYLPYGILWLASFIRSNGYKVEIFDTNVEDRSFSEVLKKKKPKIVGVSVLSGPCITDAIKKSKIIRKVNKDSKIVWGGVHVTIFPEIVLKQNYIDYIIINEAEHPFKELCDYLIKKQGNPKKIKNLGYKIKDKMFVNEIREFIDLNELHMPAWDLVSMRKYIHKKFYSNRVITLNTSRGCPWNCKYCYNRKVNFRRWRGITAEKIVEQILYLKGKYGIDGFQFYDDEFDANTKRVEEFCRILLERNIKIKWGHYSRVNIANKERFALEKRAGCRFIEFGVESGSQRILEWIRPNQTIEMTKRAFKICHEVDIKAGAMFMIGLPKEEKEDVDKTVELIKSLNAHQTINTIYRPYPGSELYDYCLDNKLFALPEKLEEHGKAFDIGSTDINASNVDTSYLTGIFDNFAFNNVKNEIIACIRHGNILLFSHYVKKFMEKQNRRWVMKALRGWTSFNLRNR